MTSQSGPKKIAILGGGVGAMAAAFGLTEPANWQEQYEITVYQIGWRLGGKGASGRNPNAHMRIEEHGLHIWAGFYENAFRIMQKCYGELGRSPDAPLATWQDAFKPCFATTSEESVGRNYHFWDTDFPTNQGVPGEGGELPSLWDYVCMMVETILRGVQSSTLAVSSTAAPTHFLPSWLHSLVEKSEQLLTQGMEDLGLFARSKQQQGGMETLTVSASELTGENQMTTQPAADQQSEPADSPPIHFLHAALRIAAALPPSPADHPPSHHQGIVWLLGQFMNWFEEKVKEEVEEQAALRHLYWRVDLMMTQIRGLIADDVIRKGLDSIDDEEWTDWLRRHGASEFTLGSPMVRGLYDYVFGYRNGDTNRRACAAGTFMYGLFRLVFTYKGSIFWKMQSGMGDTVFTPFYEVLRRRGVKFKFFHRVVNLGLSADQSSIATIQLSRQVNLKTDDYYPLLDVKGLACWPSAPLYEQIVEGAELQAEQINLESPWSGWKDTGGDLTLRCGDDFDVAVLGIALGALPMICGELIEAREEWKNLVTKVQTTATQAMQLWLKPDSTGLGWDSPPSLFSVCSEPINTWADMSHLLPREAWPEEGAPQNLAYFCGLLEDAESIPGPDDTNFPVSQSRRVNDLSVDFLNTMAGSFWPQAVNEDGSFKWDLLIGSQTPDNQEPLGSQYLRANVSPSERYVLSAPGSAPYRLSSDGSGFANLYLVGDWVKTAINAGCVEAAVMAGLQASRAICGYPQEIIGDKKI